MDSLTDPAFLVAGSAILLNGGTIWYFHNENQSIKDSLKELERRLNAMDSQINKLTKGRDELIDIAAKTRTEIAQTQSSVEVSGRSTQAELSRVDSDLSALVQTLNQNHGIQFYRGYPGTGYRQSTPGAQHFSGPNHPQTPQFHPHPVTQQPHPPQLPQPSLHQAPMGQPNHPPLHQPQFHPHQHSPMVNPVDDDSHLVDLVRGYSTANS